MRPHLPVLFALAASLCLADDFDDRFGDARTKLGDLDPESQSAAAGLVLDLAEKNEDRLVKLLPRLDLDAMSRARVILEDHGFYFDSKRTKRAREILEALSTPPPARQRTEFAIVLAAPDPERRKLLEEFLAIGPTSVATLVRELGSFEAEPVPVAARVVEVGEKTSCTFRMKNVGQRPLWFLPESAVAGVRMQEVRFGISHRWFREQAAEAMKDDRSAEDHALDLLALMTRVKPGEEFGFASTRVTTDEIGMAVVAARPIRADRICGFDFPLEASFGGQSLTLVLPRPKDLPVARVYVMAPSEIRPYTITAKYDGDLVSAEIVQTDDDEGSHARPAYCWLIMERADGTVAGSGEFGESVLAEKEWKKGTGANVDLGLPPMDGTRRIWVGFQVTGDGNVARVAEAIEVKEK